MGKSERTNTAHNILAVQAALEGRTSHIADVSDRTKAATSILRVGAEFRRLEQEAAEAKQALEQRARKCAEAAIADVKPNPSYATSMTRAAALQAARMALNLEEIPGEYSEPQATITEEQEGEQ